MSRRPDRWWRPSTTRRPPLRARQPRRYTLDEVGDTFDTGFRCGQLDEQARQQRDDLLDVADVAGVTPLDELSDAGQLAGEVERWLRDQE